MMLFPDNHFLVILEFSRKKTQGSEFDDVLLIMPGQMSDVLSRELLYTAVTRSRHRVEIWGDEEVFRRAVERRIERSSGLRDRLWNEERS